MHSFNSFTVTAVPEPATGVVLLSGTIAGFWLKRRNRKVMAALA
jgi:uncharacterized membrane protein